MLDSADTHQGMVIKSQKPNLRANRHNTKTLDDQKRVGTTIRGTGPRPYGCVTPPPAPFSGEISARASRNFEDFKLVSLALLLIVSLVAFRPVLQ